MTQIYDRRFYIVPKPLKLANDNGPTIGGRIVGQRTLLQLHTIEGLLMEELRGLRTLSPDFKNRLLLDRADLRNCRFSTDHRTAKPDGNYIQLNEREPLNAGEMMAIIALLEWTANDRGCPIGELENIVTTHFSTTGIEKLGRDQYTDAVDLLIRFHSVHGNQ